jgi:hypothetical protein
VELPIINLENFDSPSTKSPTGKWFSPAGEAVIIAPFWLQVYPADLVLPAFAAAGLWRSPDSISAYYLGTDPFQKTAEDRNLFFAGLVFGVAGAALIGSVQELTSRYRLWRDHQKRNATPFIK